MRLNNTQNAKRNIAWGFINRVINIILPFLTRTLIIYELGINYIGLGSLFSSVLSTLSLAELGFDIGIVTIMYKSVADNDKLKLCALLNFIKKAYLMVGCIILIAGCLFLPCIPLLIKDVKAIPSEINIYILFLIYLLNTVTTYFFGGYKNCILEAYQRQDIVSNINSVIKILLFILQMIVLLISKNYYLYSTTIVICGIITNIKTSRIVTRIYPDIIPKGKVDNNEIAKLKKLLYGTFLSKIGTVLGTSFDNIVVSTFLGLILLGYYSNYLYIITSIQGFISVIYVSLQAGFGNSVTLDTVEKNYLNLERYTFGYSWILGWCTICLMYLSSPFIEIWIGGEGVLPNSIVFLCVLCFYVANCFAILGTYKNAIGIWWEDRYRCLITGVANLIINIALVLLLKKYGAIYSLAGVVVSTILTTGFIGIPWSAKVTFDIYFKKGLKKYMLELLRYMISTYLIMLICYPAIHFISKKNFNNSIIVLLLRALFLCIVPNVLYCLFYWKNPHLLFFKGILKSKFIRKRG